MNHKIESILNVLSDVILDKPFELKIALCCLLSKGHLLIEDLPGMGKTTLAHALAKTFNLQYQRIQFTNDLLPMDITGSSVFNSTNHTFDFHPGPIFTQLLLADELNRASPKTQSALLEAMEENQVTVDKKSYPLDTPFFVIATQNPREQFGTHDLPESQLDRFFMRLSLGFPSLDAEKQLILNPSQRRQVHKAISNAGELVEIQMQIEKVNVSPVVVDYILKLVSKSRNHPTLRSGLSPRASISLVNAAKSWAFMENREFVTPDDVRLVAPFVCAHRLGMSKSEFSTAVLDQVAIGV
ncbi:AAA family ATPase [Pseudoalteromonas xiamenensis]|uniref:AAA family ATPase n=1 Tax=Pseudoalteromonas xiamenensis TaxID=882626 RepID=UPI0027E57A9D|nr:MoxR family ATPase [Pseudoalteromonas xiamenensis]WMN60063.1 AAA family ATPase [Pseudoalteromonas xiamenensis]